MRWAIVATLGVMVGRTVFAAPTVQVSPSPIVLGDVERVTIAVKGLPGSGEAQAWVNVGEVESVSTAGETIRLGYRPPKDHFPQMLCLLLWRDPVRPLVVRLPMLAHTELPVRTQPDAQVTLAVGDRVFGPHSSGKTGRLKITVLVPPGMSQGRAEAIGRNGLVTTRTVHIRQPPYNTLALGVSPSTGQLRRFIPRAAAAPRSAARGARGPARRPAGARGTQLPGVRFEIIVASAVAAGATPTLMVARQTGPSVGLPPRQDAPGRWSATWSPDASGEWTVTAAGQGPSRRSVRVVVAPAPSPPPPASMPLPVVRLPLPPRPTPAGFWKALGWGLTIAAGAMHNTGELLTPRFSLEGGADHRLWIGRLGLRLHVGLGWGGKEIRLDKTTSSASVVLVPIGVLASYQLPIGRLTPGIALGPLAQVVSYRSDGTDTGQVGRSEVVAGILALVEARLAFGPGALLLRAGYQHSRLDSLDVTLLAGGILAEAGYQLDL